MNILVVNYEYPPLGGGGGVMTKSLVENFPKGHNIHVLTSGINGLKSYEYVNGIHIHRARVFFRGDMSKASFVSLIAFVFSGLFKGIGIVKKYKIDLIHSVFVLPSGLVGFILAKIFEKKHLVTIIGGEVYDPSKKISASANSITRFVGKLVLNNANRIFAISNDMAKRAKNIYKLQKPVSVIGIGIDLPKRQKNVTDHKYFTVVTVARLVKRKNVDNLLIAIAKMPKDRIRLIIGGGGPEMSALRRLTSKLNIKKQVSFIGIIDTKKRNRLLSKANCFVLVSLHEGFGIVYLEAMSYGLPVIAGRTGGQNDFLVHGKTGYLVTEGNPEKLARAILKLKRNKVLIRKIGRYNKKIVKMFSSDKIAKIYGKHYLELSN
jgi:L-malate glycosyltransferase